MYCPKCYRMNDDDRDTCIKCGATLRKKPLISTENAEKVITAIKTEAEKSGVADQLRGIKAEAEKRIATEREKRKETAAVPEAIPVACENPASTAEKTAEQAPVLQSAPSEQTVPQRAAVSGATRIPQKLLDFDAKKKRVLTLVILALGAVMVLAGFLILCQNGVSHTGHNGGLVRASTSIEFGGDFYTTSAQTTALAANAVTDLYKLVSIATGLFFMFAGGVEICVTLLLTDIKELFGKQGK